jgi:RNA polymerase-binding protein DksA
LQCGKLRCHLEISIVNPSEVRTLLLRKRNEIFGRVSRLHEDVDARSEPYNADSTEQAIELENLDVLFELDAVSRTELRAINNALEHIDAGNYGMCVNCGKPISAQRLKALPYADNCIDCAR